MTNTKEKIPACPAAGKCGGCAYQGIPYEEQLQKKKEQVRRLLRDICPVRAAVGMEDPYHYRNKVHAAFGRLRDGRIVSGIYQEGTHKIVPVDSCLIEDQTADSIIRDIRGLLASFKIKIYNEDSGYGLLRHVLIRRGFATGQVLVALVLARPTKLTGFYRAAFYIPSLMGGSVAVALLWKQLFAYKGTVNGILALVGLAPVKWLTSPQYALYTLIGLGVWQFGSSMLIFLAALKNVPQSYHEAAIVDGAGPVRRFFSIVLPMITPIFFFNLVNQTIGAFQAFNSSYLITQGKPLNTTLYYGVHLYNRAFTYYEMGYGSAMAWFMLLVIAAFTALIFRSSSAWVYYESEGR